MYRPSKEHEKNAPEATKVADMANNKPLLPTEGSRFLLPLFAAGRALNPLPSAMQNQHM